MSASAPETAVLVVCWQSSTTIIRCVESVPESCRLVVVDNASDDGTADLVAGVRPDAQVVRNPANRGYAAAVNQALALVTDAPYTLLLNPDAELRPGTLERLIRHMEAHPTAAVAGARVVDLDGRPERFSAGWEPTLARSVVHELGLDLVLPLTGYYSVPATPAPAEAVERDWIAGTCMLVRTAARTQVGDLDESFFLYCEDMDWCARFRAAGWSVHVVTEAEAGHVRAASVSRAGELGRYHRVASIDRYFASRHGTPALVTFRVVRILGLTARALWLSLSSTLRPRPGHRLLAGERWRDARLAVRLLVRGS